MMGRISATLILFAAFASPASSAEPTAAAMNQLLGRGINVEICLEAPREGEWGLKIEKE